MSNQRTRHLSDALLLATQILQWDKVAIVVATRGVQRLAPAKHHQQGELRVWIRGRSPEDVIHVTPDASKLKQPINCQNLTCEVEDVDLGRYLAQKYVPGALVCT